MPSKIDYFPRYLELGWFEKFILNNCCYFPPKPRRERGVEIQLDLTAYERKFTKAFRIEELASLDGKRILDFGCGEGGFTVALANQLPNAHITGVDLLEGQQAASKIIEAKKLENIEFVIADSVQLPDKTYDLVFSHDSFEHFEDPKHILSEMIRLTKPQGLILVKFGPTWASPYGRHMGGTYKKSWPWIHLFIPEKVMMRVHSVYHNRPMLYEKFKDLEGGLNKMTVKKALGIVKSFDDIEIIDQRVSYIWKGQIFKNIPLLRELFSDSLYIKLKKR